MRSLLVVSVILAICSCKSEKKKQGINDKQREIETGILDSSNRYEAEQIGWSVTVDPAWEVQSKEATRKNNERGKKAMEQTVNAELNVDDLVQLINLRKGRSNSFLSTIQPFNETKDGSYEEVSKLVYGILKQTYEGQGITASYEEDSVLIDGLRFNVFNVTIYSDSKRSKVLLRQHLYSRLINGYDFGMTTSYQDEDAKKELEAMVQSSKFSKRE